MENIKINKFLNLLSNLQQTKFQYITDIHDNKTIIFKKGGEIKIKKKNKGKFTEYCNGKVTSECIARGKRSPNPVIRKRATFADNARRWKHQLGGVLKIYNKDNLNNLLDSLKQNEL